MLYLVAAFVRLVSAIRRAFWPQAVSGLRAQLSHVLGATELAPFIALMALFFVMMLSFVL